MLCNNISRVLDAVRSRTLPVRVPAPSEAAICDLLQQVARKESIMLPPDFAARVGALCRPACAHAPALTALLALRPQRCPRSATCAVRCCRWRPAKWQSASSALSGVRASDSPLTPPLSRCHLRYPFKPDQIIQNTDWELYITQIAKEIITEQSPKTLYQVRMRLYELLVNAISPELILRKLTSELLLKLDSELKAEVCAYAAYFEHRLQLGQKAIIHLEAFVARFMAIYKRYMLEMFG